MAVAKLNSMSFSPSLRVLLRGNTREHPIEPLLIKKYTSLKINPLNLSFRM